MDETDRLIQRYITELSAEPDATRRRTTSSRQDPSSIWPVQPAQDQPHTPSELDLLCRRFAEWAHAEHIRYDAGGWYRRTFYEGLPACWLLHRVTKAESDLCYLIDQDGGRWQVPGYYLYTSSRIVIQNSWNLRVSIDDVCRLIAAFAVKHECQWR